MLKPAKVVRKENLCIVIDLPDVRKRYMQFPKLRGVKSSSYRDPSLVTYFSYLFESMTFRLG